MAVQVHTTDYLALCSAIVANPDDDTPRLMLADEIQAMGDDARAELIRVQCKLANCDTPDKRCHCGCTDCFWCPSQWREAWLIQNYAARWRKGPVCEKCVNGYEKHPRTGEVIEQWCRACDRTCDAGGLMRREELHDKGERTWVHRVDYVCGMKRVHVTLAECIKEQVIGVSMIGESPPVKTAPSDWLRFVLTHYPDVVEVWVTDREPWGGPGMWGWAKTRTRHNDRISEREEIPPAIWELLNSPLPLDNSGWKRFDKRELALTVLARTVVRWGRKFLEPK